MSDAFQQAAFARMQRETSGGDGGGRKGRCQKIRAALMKVQIDFIDDPEQFKSCLCPRRCGKTHCMAAYLVLFCEENAGARCVFGTMTLKRAWQLIVNGKEGLRNWNKKYELGLHFNEQKHIVTFPNGSQVFVMGFETAADIDKVRGEPFDLILLDECKSFPEAVFHELVKEAIEPTLLDNAGTLCIAGTPGSVLSGTFWEATSTEGAQIKVEEYEGEAISTATNRPIWQATDSTWSDVEFMWSRHGWAIADNTAHKVVNRRTRQVSTLWEDALKLKRRNRWADSHPIWRREYLGEWVADASLHVSSFSETRNTWTPKPTRENPLGLPTGHEWRFGLGADLGFDNLFALQVFAWCADLITAAELLECGVKLSAEDVKAIDAAGGLSCYFQVYEYAAAGLTIGPIVGAIQHAREVVGTDFDFIIGDRGGLGKMIFATIEEEYALQIEAADKHERNAHIEVWNSDFGERRCFLKKGSRLAAECSALTWKLPRGVYEIRKEGAPLIKKDVDDTCAKDNFDAGLYCVTRAQHRFAKARPNVAAHGTPEWRREQKAKQWEEMQAQISRRRSPEIDSFDMNTDGYGTRGVNRWQN